MTERTAEQTAMHVSTVSILVNLALSAFKLAAGILAQSGAMVSDAVHSASDVISTFIVMIGVKMSARASDHDHPYGHERMECVAALLLAGALALTGAGIGLSGIEKITTGGTALVIPGTLALIAAILSIISKEIMFQYTKKAAKTIHSSALMADAWHHRSDALSSIGSFVGILGARLGFPILDPLASVVICIFIIKAAYDIFRDAVSKMTDHACDDETINELCELVQEQDGVLGIDKIQTRLFGDKIYVDIEIRADGDKSLRDAHAIAQHAHDAVEKQFPNVKHCMIHVNPTEKE